MTNRERHVIAMKEAARAHRELGIKVDQQVDPFDAIARAGVTVAVVPLANLSGAYLPAMPETDGRPGILVNAKHPRTRQRYTAAHELCHHLRDRNLVLDQLTEILPRDETPRNDIEGIAEAFAGWFLMPRRLVDKCVHELAISTPPRPEDVYRLSLALGTSYLATASHLYSLGRISRNKWFELSKLPPKWIKEQIAVHGPGDSWGDVWHVTDGDRDSRRITPRPGDEIIIDLEELPSSGYTWTQPAGRGFEVAESTFEQVDMGSASDPVVGGLGRRRVVLRATEPGDFRLEMVMRRPWREAGEAVRRFRLQMSVQQPLLGYMPLAEAV